MFSDFLNPETDNVQDEEPDQSELRPNKTAELVKAEQEEFSKRWGWLMIAKNVADFANDTFLNVMQMKAIEVLTLATLVGEQSELIKLKHGNQ